MEAPGSEAVRGRFNVPGRIGRAASFDGKAYLDAGTPRQFDIDDRSRSPRGSTRIPRPTAASSRA